MGLSFQALQPFWPRIIALPYAAAIVPCIDCTDCSDATDATDQTDVTDLTDELMA